MTDSDNNVITGLLNVLRALGIREHTAGELGLPRVKLNSTASKVTQVEVVAYATDTSPEALVIAKNNVQALYDELTKAYGSLN